MATTLTPTQLSRSALTPLPDPTVSDQTGVVVANGGSTILHIKNSGATPGALAVAFGRTVDGQAITPLSIPVPASGTWLYRIGGVSDYGANVTVTPSLPAITVRAYQL